jgi:hypothetical protein
MEVRKTADVFVAGGFPTVTYNPRDTHLERTVYDYLRQPGKALSVSGPTKSGKTVLIERIVPQDKGIWIHGPDLTSVEAFWGGVANKLQVFDEMSVAVDHGAGRTRSLEGSIGYPGIASIKGNAGKSEDQSITRTVSRRRPASDAVREILSRRPTPIVIDDFHYIPEDAKRGITRAVKTLIPTNRVIMVAVPHEAFEVVRQEPDMDGRVWQLKISHWKLGELQFIADEGFQALNVSDLSNEVGRELAKASYGAPFLMQQLCFDLMSDFGVDETLDERLVITSSDVGHWPSFFRNVADRWAPGVFEKLLRGPDPRGQQRTDRRSKDGLFTTDVYGVVLYAIGDAGHRTAIPLGMLKRSAEQYFEHAPSSQQMASCLNHMKDIAWRSRGASDPALDFKDGAVHVLDPFLAFYLRYGSWMGDSSYRSADTT